MNILEATIAAAILIVIVAVPFAMMAQGIKSAGSLLGIEGQSRPNFWCGRMGCGHEIDAHSRPPVRVDKYGGVWGSCRHRGCRCIDYISAGHLRYIGVEPETPH